MAHRLQTIVHPTDFSDASVNAFAHALRITLAVRGKLYLVHIAEFMNQDEVDDFPHIRHAFAQWRLLDENDSPMAVGEK